MDINLEELEMIDIVAYQSSILEERLQQTDVRLHQEIIFEHIESTSALLKLKKSVPDFKTDLDWFNVTEPLSLTDSLKGKVVVLDFFTYCCINCMHILPDLKAIETDYTPENGLVVVGVHSAKFSNERDSANILSAIQRYGITHPIVNDVGSSMWHELNISCWPTLLVLGPNSTPLFVLMGEGHRDLLRKYVSTSIEFYNKQGNLSNVTIPLNPSIDLIMSSTLRFPAKCASFRGEKNIFAVSDSGNNRILVFDSEGTVLYKIGGKESGYKDGSINEAKFNAPQGITFFNENVIIVADTENHAIRRVDFRSKQVTTLVGTGKQGNDRIGGKIGTFQDISSPWDVAIYKTRDMDMSFHVDERVVPEKIVILIAMAGTHQIWGYFIEETIWWKFKKCEAASCWAIIGNGSEENRNNSYPQNAAFAQPSGLALTKQLLYIADSESSSIRKASLIDGKVMAVVGGDRNPLNLFAYGDVDGKMVNAKLQHPLGVTADDRSNYIYVADTYNHKIKMIDSTTNTIQTINIKDCNGDSYQFNEPGGLCLDSSLNQMYVADTNNHCILRVSLKSSVAKPLALNFSSAGRSEVYSKIRMHDVTLNNNGSILKIRVSLNSKDNTIKLTENAPQKWFLELPDESFSAHQLTSTIGHNQNFFVVINIPQTNTNTFIANLKCDLNMCSENACFPQNFCLEIPINVVPDASNSLDEKVNIILAKEGVSI